MSDRSSGGTLVVGTDPARVRESLVEIVDEDGDRDAVTVRVVVPDDARLRALSGYTDSISAPAAVTVTTGDPATAVREAVAAGTVERVVVADDGVDISGFDSLAVPVSYHEPDIERGPRPLVRGRGFAGFLVTFALAYGFYLLLGDPTDPFDLVTGAVTAGAVAASLSSAVVEPSAALGTVAVRAVRATAFLPYLLFEILRANLGVAAVVLRPSLPIDPTVVTYDPDLESRFARAVLANAVTLTPGTLTVAVDEDGLHVHTLTPGTRAALVEGSLARAVAWVFHGRDDA